MSKIFSIVSRFIEDFVRKLNCKNIFPISLVPLFNHRTTNYFLINLSHLGKHFKKKRVNSCKLNLKEIQQCSGCNVVVAERSRFFLTSSLPLIEILQNHFQLHNCNNHTTTKFHMDSQVDLNMNKASNFVENRRNRKNDTKPYDRILEAPPIQVYSNTGVNVLLSRNNYLLFGSTYPTSCFYKDNWFVNHKNEAALIKLSKNVSAV